MHNRRGRASHCSAHRASPAEADAGSAAKTREKQRFGFFSRFDWARKGRESASLLAGAFALLSAALAPSFTENAVANGETRTLYLYHAHTHEQIAASYLVNGQYDQAVLKQLNWFLRDWRRDEPATMDPRLFDVVWEAYRQAGATEPVNVVSAYRSPETNAMLRRRSRAVAKYSQHMLGKAMDTTMPGMPMSHVREIGMRMQRGGVGYYPNAGTPFVHLDVGSVRSWPRMSYEQLVRLFPDGKTVHLPTNNQPLARYDEAKAEIEAHGGGAYAPPERKSKSFLAFLFGGGEEDEDGGLVAPPPTSRKQWASLAPRGANSANVAADAEEEGVSPPPGKAASRGRHDRIAEAASNLPRGETTLSPGLAATEPPARPGSAGKPATTTLAVASLEQPADASNEAQDAPIDLPLPPRRPPHLLALDAPLPPVRPIELALLSSGAGVAAAPLTRSLSLPGAPTLPVAEHRAKGGGAIASLMDVAGATTPASARPEPLLAYAPAAETKNASATETPTQPRPFAAAKSSSLKSRFQSAAVSPARLDRSNFHMMTASVPTSRMSSASVLGPAISAPRSAARAEPKLFAAAPSSNRPSGFAPKVDLLPTDRFVAGR